MIQALTEVGVAVLDCEHRTPAAQVSGVPYIAIPDIQGGRVITGESRLISEADFVDWTRRTTPQAGDILVTRRGRVGDTAPIPDGLRCAIGQNLVLLRSDGTRVDQAFLRWAVRSPQWWSEVNRLLNVGAVFSSLNVKDIGRIRLDIPSLLDQQAIAEVLGALDDKIAADTALATSAESFATAEAAAVSSRVPLSDLVRLRNEQVGPSVFAGSLVDHFSLPAFDVDGLPGSESGDSIKSSKFVVRSPAVLLSKLNPRFPRIWRVNPSESALSLASTEFLVLEPKDVSTALLWAALAQPQFSDELDARVAGTSGSHQRVRPQDALSVAVVDARAIPNANAAAIEAALALADLHRRESRTLAATRDALLPQLMSGKLRVRDAESVASDAGA